MYECLPLCVGTNDGYDITEVMMWGEVSEETLMDVTQTCAHSIDGDLLSWNSVPVLIELNNAVIDSPMICDGNILNTDFFSQMYLLATTISFYCNNLVL